MKIGLDIGGSKITGVVFDGKKSVKELTIKTPNNLEDFKYSLKNLVEFLGKGKKISGLGIGMAGHMDAKRKLAVASPNIKFVKNVSFKKIFSKMRRLELENDARCFALAEARLGQGGKYKTLAGVTLGTGIGCGLISRGHVYRGLHGGAGEIGHMIADFNQTFEHYFQKARSENNYRDIGKIVGVLLINISRSIDPEAIILGGSVAQNAGNKFLPASMALMSQNLQSYAEPKVFISKLKHAGALGAALLLEK